MAQALLTALDSAGCRFALLHGADRLREEALLSDVDVVADHDLKTAVRLVDRHGAILGLVTTLVWEYDVGCASVFLSDGNVRLQFDVSASESRHGKYGLLASRAYSESEISNGLRQVSAAHQRAYLVRKRAFKKDWKAVAELTINDLDELREACHDVFDRATARYLMRILSAGPRTRTPVRTHHMLGQAARMARRVVHPVGMVLKPEGDPARLGSLVASVSREPIVSLRGGILGRAATWRFKVQARHVVAPFGSAVPENRDALLLALSGRAARVGLLATDSKRW